MHQSVQQTYSCIVRFIEAYAANPGAPDDVLLAHSELTATALNGLLGRWSAGMDRVQLKYFLSKRYTRQQFSAGMDAITAPDIPGNAAFVDLDAMAAAEFWQKADNMRLHYGVVDTPFGGALLGFTEQGLCHLSFHDTCDDPESVLRPRWAVGAFVADQTTAESFAGQIFGDDQQARSIPAWTYGTDFQIRVWRTLMQLPSGGLLNYQQLASLANAPGAARAVGSAMAKNHLAWLIPCHRVLRQSGDVGEYGGGRERKMAMLAYEAARLAAK